MQKNIFIILVIIATLLFGMQIWFAHGLQLPSWANDIIKNTSISINNSNIGDAHNLKDVRWFGFSLLVLAKMIVSGFALIYIVLIGAYMVIYSDDEWTITKQKQQLLYVLLGFLFLNVPTVIYDVFINPDRPSLSSGEVWTNTEWWILWNEGYLKTFSDSLMQFFRVFVYIVAVWLFTWSAFRLLSSRWKEEYKKAAVNRFLYGSAALLFLGIAEVWLKLISSSEFSWKTLLDSQIASQIFNVLFFLSGPVAIFFLILGSYYYITSAWDEDKAKKWKNIIIYTIIATLLLIASFSFVDELTKFFS